MKNGVKQGAILSPILFCFYMNNLFKIMKIKRTGCFIGEYFAGMYGYADDPFLISPSRKVQHKSRSCQKQDKGNYFQ